MRTIIPDSREYEYFQEQTKEVQELMQLPTLSSCEIKKAIKPKLGKTSLSPTALEEVLNALAFMVKNYMNDTKNLREELFITEPYLGRIVRVKK